MKYEFITKDGIKIKYDDLCNAHWYFEAACTGEYVQESHPELNLSDEEALKFGYEVRRLMDKYELYEEEAIEEVLEKHINKDK